jgi:hypothetical protein
MNPPYLLSVISALAPQPSSNNPQLCVVYALSKGESHAGDIVSNLIAPAVIAVVFTAFTSFFLERLKSRRDAVTSLSNALREDLSSLILIGTEYWSSNPGKNDALKEANIMAGIETVSAGLRSFQKKRNAKLSPNLDAWIIMLRDYLTGGAFQTAGRTPDFTRVQSASAHLTKMRYRIFEERLRRL